MSSKYIGLKFLTNEGYYIEIINIESKNRMTILFEDGNIVKNVDIRNIKGGRVKNLNHPSICKIGYIGYGQYNPKTHNIYYKIWDKMIRRCHDYKMREVRVSYTKAKMCKEWYNFQNFAQWCDKNYVEGWTLDKDLLSSNDKIYSPQTCCFLPNDLNNILSVRTTKGKILPVGVQKYKKKYRVTFSKYNYCTYFGDYVTPEEALKVYLKFKKEYIIEMANKYKDLLKPEIYLKLLEFEVIENYHDQLY